MTELCGEFGISRKTGYKWLSRYQEGGMKVVEEHSRATKTVTCRTEATIEKLICGEKRLHPTWGLKKSQQRSHERSEARNSSIEVMLIAC